jgi:hypothetical protein
MQGSDANEQCVDWTETNWSFSLRLLEIGTFGDPRANIRFATGMVWCLERRYLDETGMDCA